jgi:uncharacterized membrane protein YtjA (UPF0391 family)
MHRRYGAPASAFPDTLDDRFLRRQCWRYCSEVNMLYWAFVFLIVAIVAGALGFGGIAGAAAGIAKVIFGIFIVLFVLGLLLGWRATSRV